MRKKFFLSIPFLFLLVTCFVPIANANNNDNNSVTITKYKLTESTLKEANLPVDGTKADDSIGLKEKSLEPMKGISYLIERVTLSDSRTGFKPVTGINSFKAQIVTNESGIAYIDQLNQGMYRITEEENSKIKGVMDPVILELPLPRPSGLSLTDVFLYPKSSVADGNTQVVKPREDTGKLPQTSGNVGSYESIIWSIAFVFGMGLIGFYMIYRKKEIV